MKIIPGMDIMNKRVTNAINLPWIPDFQVDHDPLNVARYWKEQGAETLYIADMEGARLGTSVTLDIIQRIIKLQKQ